MTKIIAELCQNHNGDKNILAKMIKSAAKAGADYVKGQIIFSEDLAFRPRFEEGIIEDNGIRKAIKRPFAPELERLSKLDLKDDDFKWFMEECAKNGAVPIVTIFSRKRIPFAASLPWPEKIVKVASSDIISIPFLKELCDVFDHLIVSTGGATDEEIEQAAKTIKEKRKKLTLLHCVSIYPNTFDVSNLSRMDFLRNFSDSAGWSDHTLVAQDGIKASKVAIALGADMVERHFTVLEPHQTKDGPVSINQELLKELSDFAKLPKKEQKRIMEQEIPDWRVLFGSPKRHFTLTEALNMDYFRGRFASKVDDQWVYNWEDKPVL
jgi:sialic acid synthase SpsE